MQFAYPKTSLGGVTKGNIRVLVSQSLYWLSYVGLYNQL